MTNQEYEAACITAAKCYDRFEGEHKLKQCDGHIATLEAALAKAQEARREICNRYNLNKPESATGSMLKEAIMAGYAEAYDAKRN
nr:MAG TPA: hypothetical protein [Caudoviricetes sp.]